MQEKNLDTVRFFTNTKNNIHFFSEKVNLDLALVFPIWYNYIVQSFGKGDKYQTSGLVFFGHQVILNN